jgi:nitrogen fixation protein NifT
VESARRKIMPSVMIRRKENGNLLFYVAKKDMEETIASVETDTSEAWGGEVLLTDGSKYYIDPISPPPQFPTTLRFKKA